MKAQARAGIDLIGPTLRYAEVEQYGLRYRLLRLGSCEFDFDLADHLLQAESPVHVPMVVDALTSVFEGSRADTLHITLHPPYCHSFFIPLPEALPWAVREERMRAEASALTGQPAHELRIEAQVIATEWREEELSWHHVLVLPDHIYRRFRQMARRLPQRSVRLHLSMQSAASAVQGLERMDPGPSERPFTLAVGWYDQHVEYVLTREGRWRFSLFAPGASPTNGAYFALMLLRRVGAPVAQVGRLFAYGQHVEPAVLRPLEQVLRLPCTRLNPLKVVDLDPESLDASFDAEAYVSCLGGAL
ncbi:MAG: hypothetical protein AAGI71_12640 [Bacteroidota bacterium]